MLSQRTSRVAALRAQRGHHLGGLCGDLRGVRRAGAQHELDARVEVPGRREQVPQPLLPGDPTDEQRVRALQVDAQPLAATATDGVGANVWVSMPLQDDVHLGRVELGVGVEDVDPHALADRDDGVGGLEGRALRPGRQAVAAAELLGLPRAVRLEGVRGDDVRYVVQQATPR